MCGCTGSCSCSSTRLPIGPTGATGADGDQGLYGGFSSDWVFSTSTGSGPASTNIRLNSATYASVTTIYISNVNADALDLTNFLLSFENNSNFGYIRLFNQTNNTKYWYGQITALVNNVSEIVLTVTYIDHNDSFTAADSVVVTFSPSGAGSSIILSNNTTDVSTVGAGTDPLMSYVVPINTLKNNEDVLEIDASYIMSGVTQGKLLTYTINGAAFYPKVSGGFIATKGIKYVKSKITLTRKSATAIFITIDMFYSDDTYLSLRGYHLDEGSGAGIVVADLSTNVLTFACFGENTDSPNTETITQNQLLVKYFNK